MAEKRRAREQQEQEISTLTSEVEQLFKKMTADKQEENARGSELAQIRMSISSIECAPSSPDNFSVFSIGPHTGENYIFIQILWIILIIGT